jgi:hypothetical protein
MNQIECRNILEDKNSSETERYSAASRCIKIFAGGLSDKNMLPELIWSEITDSFCEKYMLDKSVVLIFLGESQINPPIFLA